MEDQQRKAGKRGMLVPTKPLLKFSDYLYRPKLPIVPKMFGHLIAATPPGGWGMLGNDQKGDCVMAGGAHESIIWAWATGKPIPKFTTATVVKEYLNLTGGLDTGLDPIVVAQWRQKTGFTDSAGKHHKIKAFVGIQDPDELHLAGYMFGTAGMCWALPDSAEQQFEAGEVWNDIGSPGKDGHYTPFGGVNSAGNDEYVTWAAIQGAVPGYTEKFMQQGACVAYLSKEYLTATGKSPEAINWADLEADLADVGNA